MSKNANKSILIIDDDQIIREQLSQQLSIFNYVIFTSPNPIEGQKILDEKSIDIVLCDIMMEEMNGYEFCRLVRKNEKHKLIPFIFITGDTTINDKSEALEAGADDLIFKPIQIEELLFKIKSLLRRIDIFNNFGEKKKIEQDFAKQPTKIVLVDDDNTLGMLFQFNLKKEGFICEYADSANKGFDLVKKIKPDLIISDIMMPEVDGYAFRRNILADEGVNKIPFIFLTSKGEEEDILEGYDLSIADYVLKTAGPKVVVAKVKAIVRSLDKERDKAVSELQQAANSMQMKVVPDVCPQLDGFNISQWHQTYQGIPGGDFLDYFTIDDNNLAIVLGDVMGKKWGAWYFALAYAGYVRSAIRVVLENTKNLTPADIVQQVNKSIYKDAKISEVFATLTIVIVNKETKKITYSGAGDIPIIYYDSNDSEIKKMQSNGILLGFTLEGEYKNVSVTLNKNDCIIITTDGIIESRNKEGEQFGTNEFPKVIKNLLPEDNPLDKIRSEFKNYTGNIFEDDISLITIKAL